MSQALTTLSAIERLSEIARAMPQVSDCETGHHFADGMYLRTLWRRAGTLIIGKVHKKEHFYLVLKGSVRITGNEGSEGPVTLTAPAVVVSHPGTQRAVYALEDSLCATVHRTDATDMDAIETDLVEPDERAFFGPGNALKADLLEKLS